MKRLFVFLIAGLLSIPASLLAVVSSGAAQFEVRTTGGGTNGAGFVAGASGTDYSQNDNKNAAGCTSCGSSTVNLSTTDAVAVGSTTLTSVTANFSAASVGNIIYLQGGTGTITGQWRQVQTFTNATTVVLDVAIAASTGMTMNIGGALSSLNILMNASDATANVLLSYNIVWIKAGTYTLTTAIVGGQNAAGAITWVGYNATRGDNPTGTNRPLITTATNSTRIFNITANAGNNWIWRNLRFSNTAGVRESALHAAAGQQLDNLVDNCRFTGFTTAINGNYSVDYAFQYLTVRNSEFDSNTTGILNYGLTRVEGCYFHDNTTGFYEASAYSGINSIHNSVFYNNVTGYSMNSGGGTHSHIVTNNDFVSNSGAGISQVVFSSGLWEFENNIFYNNGTYGINFAVLLVNAAVTDARIVNVANAYGANGTAPRNNVSAGVGDITLTADPFVAKASNDFSLNSTVGGGAALKGLGYPGSIPNAGTGYLDIGALQSNGGSSSGGGNSSYVQ